MDYGFIASVRMGIIFRRKGCAAQLGTLKEPLYHTSSAILHEFFATWEHRKYRIKGVNDGGIGETDWHAFLSNECGARRQGKGILAAALHLKSI